jgi:hypothetical integral membrane protein (TIGR02206 family)
LILQRAPMPPFTLFGPGHLLAIATIAASAVALIYLARKRPGAALPVRRGLAALLLAVMLVGWAWLRHRGVPWRSIAPLHLCDKAVFVAIGAHLTLRPHATEVAYFWGAAGSVLATITPDLATGFSSPAFLLYFAMHGAVVTAAFLLPFGLGRVPRHGAVWRVLLVTNLYAAGVGLVNIAWHTNFLYLMAKPPHPTPLDWFGPWPWYLLVCEVVAVLLFSLLCIPFRFGRSDGKL